MEVHCAASRCQSECDILTGTHGRSLGAEVHAAERLRISVTVNVNVLYGGNSHEIRKADLVHGDMTILTAGDLCTGDGRMLEAMDFFVNHDP